MSTPLFKQGDEVKTREGVTPVVLLGVLQKYMGPCSLIGVSYTHSWEVLITKSAGRTRYGTLAYGEGELTSISEPESEVG